MRKGQAGHQPWTLIGLAAVAVLQVLLLKCRLPTASAAAVLPQGPESAADYVKRIGLTPAIFNIFISLPLTPGDRASLQSMVLQLKAKKVMIMMTAEPNSGLSAVTTGAIGELASYVRQAEQVQL